MDSAGNRNASQNPSAGAKKYNGKHFQCHTRDYPTREAWLVGMPRR